MSLFRHDFDRPGPGVQKDEPRKKGVPRFFEILMNLFGDLVKLNLLFSLCFLPTALLFAFALVQMNVWLIFLSLVATVPVGPGLTALLFCISKMLRDDPGFVGYDFKRKFIENFKITALPGMAVMLLVYANIFLLLQASYGAIPLSLGVVVPMLLGLLLIGMIAAYFFLQAGYLDLKPTQLMRNSVLLGFRYLPRSMAGLVLGSVIWIAFVLLMPFSLFFAPLIPILGFSLPLLTTLMWIWPPVDERFKLEETIRQMDQNKHIQPD